MIEVVMRNTVFEYIGNLDTLLAVCVGALLATLGALFAELIQERRNRKRRERDTARFFGDILTSLDHILDFTFQSQKVGDPWGAMTRRLFKTALREGAVYERNRERLFDIQDMALRSRIHIHFLNEMVPIEAVIENGEKLEKVERRLASEAKNTRKNLQALNAEKEQLRLMLDNGVTAIKRERAKTAKLCAELEKIAKVKFTQIETQSYSDSIGLPSNTLDKLQD